MGIVLELKKARARKQIDRPFHHFQIVAFGIDLQEINALLRVRKFSVQGSDHDLSKLTFTVVSGCGERAFFTAVFLLGKGRDSRLVRYRDVTNDHLAIAKPVFQSSYA